MKNFNMAALLRIRYAVQFLLLTIGLCLVPKQPVLAAAKRQPFLPAQWRTGAPFLQNPLDPLQTGPIFTVNTVEYPGSDGSCTVSHCTLWEAGMAAHNRPNTNSQPDRIHFAIPNCPNGVCRINLQELRLGLGSGSVVVDGLTQQGSSECPLWVEGGVMPIQLEGPPGAQQALDYAIGSDAPGTIIRGLQINQISFSILGNNITLHCNAFSGFTRYSVGIGGSNNRIGGTGLDEGNAFWGAAEASIYIYGAESTGNRIENNWIGISPFTNQCEPNGHSGVRIEGGSNTIIGGLHPLAGNLISCNLYGVRILNANVSDTQILGNLIGTDSSGTEARSNLYGLFIGGIRTRVGGREEGAGNLISGNEMVGVWVSGDPQPHLRGLVIGNLIGTDITGTAPLRNREGVLISSPGADIINNLISGNGFGIQIWSAEGANVSENLIGTDISGTFAVPNNVGISMQTNTLTTIGPSNVISGNRGCGISNDGGGTHSNWITGNLIGTDISGQFPLGNNGDGICIYGDRDLIGGLPAEGNVIAYNGGAGIRLRIDFDTQILGNSIYGNGGLGIDGFPAGVSPGLQDQLRIQAEANGLTFTLTAPPPGAYRVEFFGNRACNAAPPLDYGEGEFFLGARLVTPSAGGTGSGSLSYEVLTEPWFLTATVTDPFGLTSEFSRCIAVSPAMLRNVYRTFTPTLTWSGVSGATAYVLQVADQPSFSTLAYENTALSAGVFADIASLPSEGLYYWRVRARFANGSFSAWSAVDQFVVDVP